MMEKIMVYIKVLSGAICSLCTYAFGGVDAVFTVLLSLMATDYITGVMAGIKTKSLSSETGFYGVLKKCGILCVVALGHFIGVMSGIPDVRSLVIGFYIANEGISIVENAGRIGVPMPEKLIDILRQLKDKN